jgi:hypothetical protein
MLFLLHFSNVNSGSAISANCPEAIMSDRLMFEQFWALRVEAAEARRLAGSFADRLTVIDLECYASELETEAAKLQLEQEHSCPNNPAPRNHHQFADLRTIICMGRA